MNLARETFEEKYSQFKQDMAAAANGRSFDTLRDGLAGGWENYKGPLRNEALRRLDVKRWRLEDVGSGDILKAVINAVEIDNANGRQPNNLVRWQNRFGHANRSHHMLLDAIESPKYRQVLEALLFKLFTSDRSGDGAIFEGLRAQTGGRYDLMAYLFFLKDWDHYMPIATMTFDRAFEVLGLELVTNQRCSWQNYSQYNAALEMVREALAHHAELGSVKLIDAHSFCWMLIRVPMELLDGEGAMRREPGRNGAVIVYDAQKKSIWEMANGIEQTVRNANGQIVQRILKNKELRMTRQALEVLIADLIQKQREECALTGLKLQFLGTHKDVQMLASVDRKDSEGHYEAGNLQIVCRFANFWKRDMPNDEFRRLLAIARREDF